MVHVRRCPLGKRGKPTTEFSINGKSQIYCNGWIDMRTDEPLAECKTCKDYVNGEQFQVDYENWRRLVEE